MRKQLRLLWLVFAVGIMLFQSCKKETIPAGPP